MTELQSFLPKQQQAGLVVTSKISKKPQQFISIALPSFTHWGVFLVLLLQGVVIAVLVVFSQVDVWITKDAALSNSARGVYVVAMTILATSVTTYTASQIRTILIKKISPNRTDGSRPQSNEVRQIEVIIGLGSVSDSIKFWALPLSFAVAGLVTAAFVAALTPSTVPCNKSNHLFLSFF